MARALCLLVLLVASLQVSVALALDAKVTKFARDFQRCMPDKVIIRIGVMGFNRDEDSLSRARQVNIRRNIEQQLQQINGIRLAPSGDLGTIMKIARSSGGANDKALRKQIANARRVDGVVLFNVRQRARNSVVFLLTGISSSADCKVISEPLSSSISSKQDFSNVGQILRKKSAELLADDTVKKIAVLPFLSKGGLDNSCNRELVDSTINALLVEQKNATRVLKNQTRVDIRAVMGEHEITDKANTVIVDGTFGCDNDGSHWVRMGFRRAGRPIISSLTKTSITGLSCGCKAKTFFQTIKEDAKSCPAFFKMAAGEKETFVGDYVNIGMTSKRKAKLYCWYLAADKTAYILVPNPNAPGSGDIGPNQSKQYPRDFGFPEQEYTQESNDMFGCFVREKPLSPDAQAYWMKKWGPTGGSGVNGELIEGEIIDMLKMMRRLEGTSECYIPVTVKKLN